MKFKLITALLGLGLTIAIPGAVMAQYDLNDQIPDQDSQVTAAPNSDPRGDSDSNSISNDQSYNTSAPRRKPTAWRALV